MTASEASTVVGNFFVQQLQTDPSFIGVRGFTNLRVMSLSAFHEGVSEHGLQFDVDALEKAYLAEHPELELKRNQRNNSLVVRLGPKLGSQIFYTTGTTQLMGVRGDPNLHLTTLRRLLALHPAAVVVNTLGRKRRRGRAPATVQLGAPTASAPKRRRAGVSRLAAKRPAAASVASSVVLARQPQQVLGSSSESDSSLTLSPSESLSDSDDSSLWFGDAGPEELDALCAAVFAFASAPDAGAGHNYAAVGGAAAAGANDFDLLSALDLHGGSERGDWDATSELGSEWDVLREQEHDALHEQEHVDLSGGLALYGPLF
mmetsp:Transcript_15859/g.37507  ORF Transcript_15859/g.37507 Transcript_15859/m.37507 type:complete len:317 (+) Transcript_15859:536-1486(+)